MKIDLMDNKQWPRDYPQDVTIPPNDAVDITMFLFRIVDNLPPTINDFLASYKDPKQRNKVNKDPKLKHTAKFYATSFYKNESYLIGLKESHPNRFKHLVEVEVTPEHGKAKVSSSDHVSVWFYEGTYPIGHKIHV